MKRVFWILLLVVAASTFSASAASLRVDAGVLQAWTLEVDLCADEPSLCPQPPGEDPVIRVSLEVRVYNSSGQYSIEHSWLRHHLATVGETYWLHWVGADDSRNVDIVSCPGDIGGSTDVTALNDEPYAFTAEEAAGFALCLQGAPGQANTAAFQLHDEAGPVEQFRPEGRS
jgi:hypothetical protein